MPDMNVHQGGPSHNEQSQRLKRRYTWLKDFSDHEIGEISFCNEPGSTMEEGEQYLDLEAPERGIIHGKAGEKVTTGHCLIGKSQVREETWQKLIRPFHK